MDTGKLRNLISEKNDRRERETLRTAETIIDQIAGEQQQIRNCEKRISELRAELKTLEHQPLDAAELLGE